jgi:hypothetical protein
MFCPGVETNRTLSSPLTSSWSMPEAHNLAACGETWRLTRNRRSLTKRSRSRGSSLRFHSHGENTIVYETLTCILTLLPSHGSLYFASDAFPGCTAANMTGDIGQNLKEYVEGRFVVGPIAEKAFNENEPQSDVANRGPCMFYNYSSLPFQNVVANRSFLGCAGYDAKDYLVAIAQRERSKLTTKEHTPDAETRDLQNEKLSTLDKFESICSHLTPRTPQLSRPTIWHWDIRPDNLFVDNGHITDMIDWQDAWIGPFFLQARRPRLVDHHGEMTLTLPDHYETIEDPDEKARVADHVESPSCSGVTSGRPKCGTQSCMRYSIFLRHRSGRTRLHLSPSCRTARSRLCAAASSSSSGTFSHSPSLARSTTLPLT